MPAEGIYVTLGQIGTFYWFAFLFLLAPLVPFIENTKPLPQSIYKYVKERKGIKS
jgi:ubiquinol-cytochrome c reductase cytochrome b subunit